MRVSTKLSRTRSSAIALSLILLGTSVASAQKVQDSTGPTPSTSSPSPAPPVGCVYYPNTIALTGFAAGIALSCDQTNALRVVVTNPSAGGSGSTGSTTSSGWGGSSAAGAYHNYPITTTSQVISGLGSGPRTYLDLSAQNSSSTDIWCNFTSGQAAIVNPPAGNDSFRIPAGADARWENSFAPADPIACIAPQNTILYAGAH